jgi:transketolase C-terminal domain/subunit
MLPKITTVLVTAAALTAVLTANGSAFSGGASHVVTHPVVMSRGAVTTMRIDPTTTIRLRNMPHYPRALSRARYIRINRP